MSKSRQSLRLKGYDYSTPGAYFLTFVLRDRRHLFGEIHDGEMRLSGPGRMVEAAYRELEGRYPRIRLDDLVVMPDHFYCIVHLVDQESPEGPRGLDLFDVAHRFKSYTTAKDRHGVVNFGWPRFRGRLWQREYYERVIRDQRVLALVRQYIRNNPLDV